MATRKENLKALFSNSRARIIIAFTLVLVVTMIVVGFSKLYYSSRPVNASSDVVRNPSGIKSIPGALNQTAQYAALQQSQNIQQAKAATAKGTSAIPTIIRSQAFGEGVESVGAKGGEGSVGFGTLARQNIEGPQSSVWFQNLKDQHCDQESLTKAMDAGATIKDLKQACTCQQLKRKGFNLSELKQVCSCPDLRSLGFSAKQFKEAGFCAADLKVCGFTACEERGAGFTADEMKNAGYSDGQLSGAGFSPRDIAKAGGLPAGVTLADVRKAGCSAENLRRLRSAGVSAAAIKRTSGCSAAALKAAGYSALDLKNAGFSAGELKAAGFSPEQLKQAGYNPRELMDAGFSAEDLAAGGFAPSDIAAAEAVLPLGMTKEDIRKAGCSAEALKRERMAGVSAYAIKKLSGCSASALKAAGFSAKDLARAGFTPAEINAAGAVGPGGIVDKSGVPDDAVRKAGCDPAQLKMLHDKGVTARRIHEISGCSAEALKAAGYGAADLIDAGFTPGELSAAGFTPEEIKKGALLARGALDNSGVSDDELRKAGCEPTQLKALHDKGVSAKRIHEISGCSAEALKAAGYGLADLAGAGFTPAELLAAGFTPEALKKAGLAISPAGLIAAGRVADCSAASLKAAHEMGMSAAVIKRNLGCSAAAMKAAGYSAAELKDAGFSAADLKAAGFSAADLKDAGFSAKDLHAAGFSAADLKAAGYDAAALKDAGFSAEELKDAGFTAADLKKAGFTAAALKDAGFSPAELKKAGFSADDLKKAGVTAAALKAAGFSGKEIQGAGFSSRDSALAGLDDITPDKKDDGGIPSIPGAKKQDSKKEKLQAAHTKKLEKILAQQKTQMADQKYQQKVQQRTALMLSAANQALQGWKLAPQQTYTANTKTEGGAAGGVPGAQVVPGSGPRTPPGANPADQAGGEMIRMGDVMFAVIDTSVNTDEPGPILATIVSGKLKGSKLIGTFNLPANAEKMVVSFNSLSIPGAAKTITIAAFAIDPNTARTALSSETDHHYLSRYGALFASTFLEGFGNAFQSADTTITIGGTGGTQDTTVQNGIGRSALENAVIGLATVGKAWGQVAQQNMSRPTTVQLYSGTGVGVLFTQDVKITT
ncbi:MAG: type IVB secretion system protein DotG/IcmE [Gammaproteobacteria bacterium]|nr:type IVB secretion system protein DotG/IcmE [Gammaproteobacteria bacterium]